ncbi:MAG TPA: PhzF family phenazine biosynthesis protein [Nitrososphaerales archaeon]|nr:PhzF family phenazine biosynthesis protein [Nitrososphaerales archaeon]
MRFYIVDVFGETRYTGNQLAVFRNARPLNGARMQAIAKEMNFSETTFILSDRERRGGFDVRIFTPNEELPFAGHPTLGTAFVIMREVLRKPVETVALNLKVGKIPVTAAYLRGKLDLLWMRQKAPTFGAAVNPRKVAAALGLSEEEIDSRFPVEEVSTGLSFVIVPIRSRRVVKRCRVDLEKYGELMRDTSSTGIFVFCPEPYDGRNDFNARMFAPGAGVMEDPATGSANGCFAAYLVKHRYKGKPDVGVRVEQGYEIGRPSLLYLKAREREGAIEVNVGGRATMVAKGEFV